MLSQYTSTKGSKKEKNYSVCINKLKTFLSNPDDKNDDISQLIPEYDSFPSFVDNGNQKTIPSKKIGNLEITLIPGKTSDGDQRYPAYKLEYDVFWVLRMLAKHSGIAIYNKGFLTHFTLNELSNILMSNGKKYHKWYIKKGLEILSTAKFQVKNRDGELKEYRYLKNLSMPTHTELGIATFDDSFIEAIESGNYRQINVKKLLSHTTAGGRFMYQRMYLKFTGAEENNRTYNRRYDKLITDIHRKDEFVKLKFRYLKTIAKDLRNNGSIVLSDEEIRKNFSVKQTKANRQMLYFPVSSDLIAEIKHANQVAKCTREKYQYIAIHGNLEGFQYSWLKDKPKQRYKKPPEQKESYVADLSREPIQSQIITGEPNHINPPATSPPIDYMSTDVTECEQLEVATSPGLTDQSQESLAPDSKFNIPISWQPSVDVVNLFINKTEHLDSSRLMFIHYYKRKKVKDTNDGWNERYIFWMQKHLAIMQDNKKFKKRSIEEELNDSSWI